MVSLYDTAISADVVGDQGGCQYVPTCAERERERCANVSTKQEHQQRSLADFLCPILLLPVSSLKYGHRFPRGTRCLAKDLLCGKRNIAQKYWAVLGVSGVLGVPWCFCIIYCYYATAQVGRLVTQRLCSMGKFQVNGAGARAFHTRQRFRHCNTSFVNCVKVLRDKERARGWVKLSKDVSARGRDRAYWIKLACWRIVLQFCRTSNKANFTGWTCDRTCTTFALHSTKLAYCRCGTPTAPWSFIRVTNYKGCNPRHQTSLALHSLKQPAAQS